MGRMWTAYLLCTRITLETAALRVICIDGVVHWRLKTARFEPPAGPKFWEKVHQRKYFHKIYEFCVHQTCKFHTKIHKFDDMFANFYECQLEIFKISAPELNFHQKSLMFIENPEFQKFSRFLTHEPNPMCKNNLSYSQPPNIILGQN